MTLQLKPKANPFLIKEHHLRRLYELYLKTAGQKPQLEELTYEQKKWEKLKLEAWRCSKIENLEPCDCKTQADCLMDSFVSEWKAMEGV